MKEMKKCIEKKKVEKFYKTKKILEVIMLILLVIGIISYKKSLVSCNGSIASCARIFNFQFVFGIFVNIIFSSATIVIYSLLFYKKQVSYYHYIYVIPIYLYFFYTDKGDDFSSHGALNCMVFILAIIGIILLYNLLKFLGKFLIEVKMISFICYFIFIGLLLLKVYLRLFGRYPCGDFYEGISGEKTSFDERYDKCHMKNLEKCELKNFDGLFDMNYWLGYKCRHEKGEKSTFVKYITGDLRNARRYGFPRSHEVPILSIEDILTMPKKFLTLLKDLDKEPDFEHEIEVNFNEKNEGEMKIHIKRNETLVQEREAIRKKINKKFFSKNVFVLYLDAVSRRNFVKVYKKTGALLQKYLYKKGEITDKSKTFSSFQFLKFNGVFDNTFNNNIPLFYGTSGAVLKGTAITKYFKDNGYITALQTDGCVRESFDYANDDQIRVENLTFSDYDHEGGVMFCDGNYLDLEAPHRKPNGIYGPLRRCLYGKDIYVYMFDYMNQFWETYLDQPKFAKIVFNYGHELTMEVSQYLDEPLADFFQSWIDNGFFDDTSMFFISDHGNQISVFYEMFSNEHFMEKSLPLCYIFIPNVNKHISEEENRRIKENLLFNRDRFLVPYDFFSTMLNVVLYDNKTNLAMHSIKEGHSLFERVENGRNCNDFFDFARFDYEWCRCYP